MFFLSPSKNSTFKRLKHLINLHFFSFRVFPSRIFVPHTLSRCYEYPLALLYISEQKIDRFLDIGPSLEFFLYNLRKAKSIFGLDPDPRLQKKIQKFLKRFQIPNNKITYIKGDITKAPFPDNYFNMITAISTIEHIPDRGDERAMKEVERILKLGGTFILSVPFKNKWDAYWTNEGGIQRYYNIDHLKKRLIYNTNLQVEEIKFFGNFITGFFLHLILFLPGRMKFLLNWIGLLLALMFFSEVSPSTAGKLGGEVIILFKKIKDSNNK